MRTLTIFYFVLLALFTHAQPYREAWIKANDKGCKVLDLYADDNVTLTWEGPCYYDKAHGYGKLSRYVDGQLSYTIECQFDIGLPNGIGKMTTSNGDVINGTFVRGQLTGKANTTFGDGSRYEGEYINYTIHGKGVFKDVSGLKFEGFFVNNDPYTGKLTEPNGKVSYLYQTEFVNKPVNEPPNTYSPPIGERVTEYFTSDWKRCQAAEASYYRLITYEAPNRPKGIVKDYYKTGQLQSEFYLIYVDYQDESKNFHEGKSTWYHKNGKIEQIRYYVKNKVNGENTHYYSNGQEQMKFTYVDNVLQGPIYSFHENGKADIYSLYEDGELLQNKYLQFYDDGEVSLNYNEDFSRYSHNWVQVDALSKSEVTADNELVHTQTGSGVTARYNEIVMNRENNFYISVDLQKTLGKGQEAYGLIFGLKDWNNYYGFLISESGQFTCFLNYAGDFYYYKEWTYSRHVKTGFQNNTLQVVRNENELTFLINEVELGTFKFEGIIGNYYGLYCGGVGTYKVKNLNIVEFINLDDTDDYNTKLDEDAWSGTGSGFFISEKGYIATNYHVIEGAKAIQVEYIQKGVKVSQQANVVVTDPQNDLAILKITDPAFRMLPKIPYVFKTEVLDVGSSVFTLGYPYAFVLGDDIKFSDGKISAKTGIQGNLAHYQISVPVNPGNSGGPLFDEKGNLVGVTTATLNRSRYDSENINYAVKTNYLRNLIDVLPERITLPDNVAVYAKPLTDKIKLFTEFIPLIRVK